MAGDQLSTTVQYYYQTPVTNSSGSTVFNDVLGMLASAITGSGATTAATKNAATTLTGNLNIGTPFSQVIASDITSPTGDKPKAYLNIVFFDERFNFVEEASTSQRVSQSGDAAPALGLLNIKAPKNGYCIVYISNESSANVFFDNLQVRHDRGRIIEENHYYAHGLKIAAISSKAYGAPNNNYGHQGDFSEFDDDLGWNDFELRSYDPQIGRFLQNDPYDQFASGYVGMGNDPVNSIDPSGGWAATGIFQGMSQAGIMDTTTLGGAIIGGVVDYLTGGNGWTGAALGTGIGLASNFASAFNWKGIVSVLGKAAPSIVVQGADIAVNATTNSYAQYASNTHQQPQSQPPPKRNLPFTADQFNKVYNNGQPYSYKPCDEPLENGHPYTNQCAIRFSKAIMDLGVDMSSCKGPQCKHGYIRVTSVIKFLTENYNYVEVDNPKRSPFPGTFYRAMSQVTGRSSIVVMMNLIEDGTTGNHIEFLYNGMPKSSFNNTWESANKFYIFEFAK